jgi:hypothetical protein
VTRRRRVTAVLSVAAALSLTACADTVVEDGATDTTDTDADTGTDADASSIATTTTLPSGTTGELLAELTTTMGALSQLIIDGGRADGDALAHIEAVWAAARPQVEAEHPQLVSGFDTTVEMATIAVERTRPADADKAYVLLVDLVDRAVSPSASAVSPSADDVSPSTPGG